MPFQFTIKNKKSLFKFKEVLTVRQIMEMHPNLSQYNYDNSVENWNFFNSKLDQHSELWLGVEGKSTLGFRVSYNKSSNEYLVYISLYACKDDWDIMLKYLSNLSEAIGNDVVFNDVKYSKYIISHYDFRKAAEAGLKYLEDHLEDNELVLYGLKRPIIMSQNVNTLLKNSSDKIESFGKFLLATQYPKEYVHQQTFHYNSDGKTLYCNYSIGENLKGIIPKNPFVEAQNEGYLVGHPLTHFTITVTKFNEDGDYKLYKVCEYNSFIQNLPLEKYKYLDDGFIILEKLSIEELDDIIAKSTILSDSGQFISEDV